MENPEQSPDQRRLSPGYQGLVHGIGTTLIGGGLVALAEFNSDNNLERFLIEVPGGAAAVTGLLICAIARKTIKIEAETQAIRERTEAETREHEQRIRESRDRIQDPQEQTSEIEGTVLIDEIESWLRKREE